jgi:hypothetical protein
MFAASIRSMQGAAMSPRVRLQIYPDSDAAFAAASGTGLDINLPTGDQIDLVAAVLDQLRMAYPLAAILVDADVTPGGEMTWHVYRDGAPAEA